MKLELEQPNLVKRTSGVVDLPALGLILFSVLLSSAGQLAFKAALNEIGELQITLPMIIKLLTNPLMLLGLAFFAVSAFLWLVALMEADLSFAYPFLSLNYVAIMAGGVFLYNEHVSLLRLLSVGLIIVGLLTIAYGEKH